MKKLLLIIFIAFSFSLFGQNIIYKGNQQFPATETWTFDCENYSWTGDLSVQIAKTASGGYLRLAIDVPGDVFFIGGTVYLFLTDGSTITCGDKGIKDNVDQQSVVLYVLNNAEMDRLKILNIQKIRFTIKTKPNIVGSSPENFTAKNSKGIFDPFGYSKEKDFYETSIDISALFE